MWPEHILHVDMDSFFVEVERLSDESLIGRPVAVGGTGGRGVIASASYEARSFGVSSAQPTAVAMRLCPPLVVIPPNHSRYEEVSWEVFEVFRSFTPLVEGLSLDEAFLDVSGLRRHFDSPVAVGSALRQRIRERLGLPASVGVAGSKFLAKLASEAAKPDGVLHVPVENQLEFLHPLPVQALWGVGPATLAGLKRLGIETVGDLAELPEPTILQSLGPTQGRHLIDLSLGRDPRSVHPDSEAKSISVEETYESDLTGHEVIETALLAHAQRLSGRLRRAGVLARTIAIKVRYEDFTTVTRSKSTDRATSSAHQIFQMVKALLDSVDTGRPVRLLGVGASGLEASGSDPQLLLDAGNERDSLAEAVGVVREKYGEHAIEPARLLDLHSPDPESDR
ncbi:MAG: DNA polymerase IV [Acidimicrobiia bacterium]